MGDIGSAASENTLLTTTPLPEGNGQAQDTLYTCCWYRLPHAGFACAILSGFIFSICSVTIKVLYRMDPILLAFWSAFGVLLPSLLELISLATHPYPQGYRILLTVRSILSAANLMLDFLAYRLLPLGDASVILFSTPIFVPILSWIFLKEDCNIIEVIVIILATLGVNCIARPTFLFGHESEPLSLIGLICAFLGVFFKSGAYIFLRKLKDVHHSVVCFNYSLVTVLISGIICLAMGTFDLPYIDEVPQWIGLLVTSYISQVLIIIALQLEKAGIVSIGRFSDIVFAFLWQFLIFNEPPFYLSIIGAVLVTLSIIMLGTWKAVVLKQ